MPDDPNKIRITLDDLQNVVIPPPDSNGGTPQAAPQRQWGTVNVAPPTYVPSAAQGANFFLNAWVYLGIAGLAGSVFAWVVCEPAFVDGRGRDWGNYWMIPLIVTFMCVGFAISEGAVERSFRKIVIRGIVALILGCILGFVFDYIANIIYNFGIHLFFGSSGDVDPKNPVGWINRAFAWAVFGVTGGLVYGMVGRSWKKCLYGIIGGIIGAGFGGLLFDPICSLTHGGGASRCIGFMFLGASTGIAIGLVESALKDRWLYVSAGPLAGKQFILYKPVTRFGRDQVNEIYLFKDLTILPQHAIIDLKASRPLLKAQGTTFVNGQPTSQYGLRSGDVIQIGRYSFQYQEKQRSV